MSKQKKDGEPQQKSVTRYDQKLEKRRLKAKNDARSLKIYSLAFGAVVIAMIAAISASIVMPFWNKYKVMNDVYIKVGDHSLNKLEYDYYYNMSRSNFYIMYQSILPYMGIDPMVADDAQMYGGNMTLKDYLDQQTTVQISNTKALADEAAANGFSPDMTEQYNTFTANVATAANAAGFTEPEYYQTNFGSFASKANLETYIKENLLAELYYEELLRQNTPSPEEITAHYEANKNDYDKVNYRSFAFNAELPEEPAEDQIAAAMEALTVKAEAMITARQGGQDFKALCLENAAEADKATYEDEASDASLTENAAYISVPVSYSDWLFDETRKAGDITFAADETAHTVYVVEFEARNYDETTEATISETLAGQAVTEYLAELSSGYAVTDVAGEMHYLTIEETAAVSDTAAGDETGETSTALH